jgi:hypothetical protein
MNLKLDDLSGPALVALGELAGEVAAARQATGDPVAEVAAGWVGPHYLLTLQGELAARSEGAERFKLLRQAAGDVVGFQRGGMWSAKVQIEREKLEFQRQKHRDLMAVTAKLAEANAAKQRRDPLQPMTDEELKACVDKVDEIMGLK